MIYVSHRLDEVYAISDRMAVLRDGRLVAEQPTAGTASDELVRMIIGRPPASLFVRPRCDKRQTAVCFEGVQVGDVGPLDFSIAAGEIVAMVGLRGAGQEEVGKLLFGLSPVETGAIVLEGSSPDLSTQASAVRSGIGFVAGDRGSDSIAAGLAVRENMFLNPGAIGRSLFSFLPPRAEADASRRLGAAVDLQPNDPDAADRDAVGRQPAEGRDRALDAGRRQGPDPRGPDGRRRRRRAGRRSTASSPTR